MGLFAMFDTDSSISIFSLDLKASGCASKTAASVLRAAPRPALLSGGPLGLSGLTNFFHRMDQGNGADPVFTVGHMNLPLAVYQSAFSSAYPGLFTKVVEEREPSPLWSG
jgi:hypothetical protein